MHPLGISGMENIPGTVVKEAHIHSCNFCWLLLKIRGCRQIKSSLRKGNKPKYAQENQKKKEYIFSIFIS